MAAQTLMSSQENIRISAIVPTIGRPQSLKKLFESLALQTRKPDEIIVCDGSNSEETKALILDSRWERGGLSIKRLTIDRPHAVRQRKAAIATASGDLLLLLDDDVALDSKCIEELLATFARSEACVAAMADIANQRWSRPTRLWSLFLRFGMGLDLEQCQGRVLGPLLRFGFWQSTEDILEMQWFGSGNTMLRRSAYDLVGGFSDYFLHRSTINEDVDLSVRVARTGKIFFCPRARLNHYHDPIGRVSAKLAAEDDLYNRYLVMNRALRYSRIRALTWVAFYLVIESLGSIGALLRSRNRPNSMHRISGLIAGFVRVIFRPG
jgi:GT2 family glycosyltransferase